MKGTKPGFVVQEIIAKDKFSGSALNLLQAYNVKSAGDVRIENSVEVFPKKIHNVSTDSEEWLRDVNEWCGIPQQHYTVEIKMSGRSQTPKVILQPQKSRSSGTRSNI